MIGLALLTILAAPQWPEDARQLLAWHEARRLEDEAGAPAAPALRERLYVYQAAGAEAEAWSAAQALDVLIPADADGARYQVQLCVWDPSRWSEGLALAGRWLDAHVDRPEAEVRAVAAAQDVLGQRLDARDATARRQQNRAWVPWLALALFLGGSALAVRGAR